jgi:hypothetical protein
MASLVTSGRRGFEKLFKYDNMWRQHENYDLVIREGLRGGAHDLAGVQNSLGALRRTLRSWSEKDFGSVKKQLKDMRRRLEFLRSGSLRKGPTMEECNVMKRISDLLAREETMAKQRSRIRWLKEGDRNTSFFHAKAKERFRTNRIVSLKRPDGSLCSDQKELEVEANSFYKNLFQAKDITIVDDVLAYVPRKVSDQMNEQMCAPYSHSKIENALFMMKPNSSPGPDGFTVGIYIKHWGLLKAAVCDAIKKI